jgi:hypothetical protein
MRQQEQEAIDDNVDLIVEAINVMQKKVDAQLVEIQAIIPEKGDKGDKGADGKQGKDGRDGKDGKDGLNGKDGVDGKDGVSVTDAKIDFDGSLVITLSTGQEINVGEVVAPELQEKIKLVTSGGAGTVLPSQTGNANKYLKTDGSALSWATTTSGTVTSVGGTGAVSGISLSGTVTSSGNLTLGGTLDLSSPPTIGNTAPNTVTATTLIGGGSSANYGQLTGGATTKAVEFQTLGSDSNIALVLDTKGTGAIDLAAGSSGVNISNGGTVTAITRTAGGTGYTVAPTVTISAPTTAGGVQATATCTVTAGVVDTAFTITNAGSGYVEQPTITFTPVSGGSGATAYATVGSDVTIKSIGANLLLNSISGTQLQASDLSGASSIVWWGFAGSASSTGTLVQRAAGGGTNTSLSFVAKGSGSVQFATNNTTSNIQFQVSNTASAVNYVQVTGGATGNPSNVTISAQGSDTNTNMVFGKKGTGNFQFYGSVQAGVGNANYFQMNGAASGSAPAILGVGSDADIDVAFTPKGAGAVRFGTYTASVLTPTGYITIKDSGGTSRRLLVG